MAPGPFTRAPVCAKFTPMSVSEPPFGSASAPATRGYRGLVLALIAFGAVGLLVELLLLEHFEDPWQWAPVVSLALTILASAAVALRPARGTLRAFQAVMVACVVFGAIGVVLHLKGNVEFELESDPALRGWPLYWEALRGAVPALSPGALAQLGLLGLLFAYRHPAALPAAGARPTSARESST